jgi:glutathione S-transferase
MNMPIVHGVNASPFVRKVRIALQEKGLDYELDPVIPFNVSEEFRKISPLGKVPVYEPEPGVTIPDSSVIIAYLEKTKPEPALYPADPAEMAQALFFEEYGDSALINQIGIVFFQRIVGPMFMGQVTDEAAVQNALDKGLPPLLAWLDAKAKGRKFLVGDQFTVADIGITSPFINLHHAGIDVDASKYPDLAKYLAGTFERPSVNALIEEESAAFAPPK